VHGKLGIQIAMTVATLFRDASYLKFVLNDQSIVGLIDSGGFKESLMREGGARKAYQDGWRIFSPQEISQIDDFQINIPSDNVTVPIKFRFNSKVLPYDINVLIGPNGIGKSHCLQLLVEYWLKIGRGDPANLEKAKVEPFDHYPNLGKLILISYSPFEEFTLDLENTNLRDKDAYQYFGFRKKVLDEGGNERIGISRNLPASDAAMSIIRCIEEDEKFNYLPNWVSKFQSALDVLTEAIDFDDIAIALKDENESTSILRFTSLVFYQSDPFIEHEGKKFLKLSPVIAQSTERRNFIQAFDLTQGVVFIKDDRPINLSSGQRLFSYIVINVLGALKNNSLVVVDEPELFLHPNLEITFISLLKSVLEKFCSKAILATHSLVSVREVPANCVHVFRKTDFGKEVIHPPFETFGGDIQRISSYVFGDRLISKPYQDWISKKLNFYPESDSFIVALGDEISEELLMRINKIAKGR